MTAEPYIPDRGTVRYRYVDGDYSGGNRDPHAEFNRFIAKIKADAWAEGYRQGIEDERTATEVQMGVGPNRNNPYRWQEEAS